MNNLTTKPNSPYPPQKAPKRGTRFIFNPFEKIAGSKALISGILIMGITTLIGTQSHCHFDGAIDAHIGATGPFYFYFIEALISWAVVVLLFYLVGMAGSGTRIRLIDIAGTTALARFPLLIVALIAFIFPEIPPEKLMDFNDIPWNEVGKMLILGLIIFFLIIWLVILLYYAFKVSTNMKGQRLGIAFTAALILAELISKGTLYLIQM